jgi:hypothetical protein
MGDKQWLVKQQGGERFQKQAFPHSPEREGFESAFMWSFADKSNAPSQVYDKCY